MDVGSVHFYRNGLVKPPVAELDNIQQKKPVGLSLYYLKEQAWEFSVESFCWGTVYFQINHQQLFLKVIWGQPQTQNSTAWHHQVYLPMVLSRSKFRDDWSCWKITLGSLQRNVLSLDIVSTKHWNLGRWPPNVDMYLLRPIQIHSFFGYTLRSFVISTAFCGRNGQPFLDKNSTRWQSPFSAGVQGSHRLPMPRSDSTSSCSSCKRLNSIRIPPPPGT